MSRKIILDIETTGLSFKDGHRIIDITGVEMEGHRTTGREFRTLINPDRDIPAETTKIHGITNAMVADKPVFAAIAQELRDFIGDAQIVITCRTVEGVTLDMEFLKGEMEAAGFPSFPDEQWLNVRRWSEAMFGADKATLDKILDYYKIDRSERVRHGHGATLDARLLSKVYPKLLKDYTRFIEKQTLSNPVTKTKPPTP